jgi:hypothetical protein
MTEVGRHRPAFEAPSACQWGATTAKRCLKRPTPGIHTDGFATMSQNTNTTAAKAGTPNQNHTRANA